MAFGNKQRHIERLQRRIQTVVEERDDARKLAAIHQGNLTRMAKARAAQHDQVIDLRKQVEQLTEEAAASRRAKDHLVSSYTHLMDTGEPMAMFTGPSLAQQLTVRLDRALRACARYRSALTTQHRVNDRLSNQLMDAMGYTDTALMRLSIDLADTGSKTTP
jgi:hypothetical protein